MLRPRTARCEAGEAQGLQFAMPLRPPRAVDRRPLLTVAWTASVIGPSNRLPLICASLWAGAEGAAALQHQPPVVAASNLVLHLQLGRRSDVLLS